MSSRSSLALNPDGHGGLPFAMSQAGLFSELKRRHIETLFYHQVDNPLVHVCDPAFVGLHLRHAVDVSVKYVSKRTPAECLGLLVEVNGQTRMIEYSDLPKELGELRDSNGNLKLRVGNTGIHLFQIEFLERIASRPTSLPWHSVHKKVPFVDDNGKLIHPESANALKYERFIFDSFPLAETVLAVETDRDREFAPLKNAEGDCSAETVTQQLIAAATRRLRDVGVTVEDGTAVELAHVGPDDSVVLSPDCPHVVAQPTLFEGIRIEAGHPSIMLHVAKTP
jgi:UDP-N-acetylglucosamine/UDP-N-acetylgalactosamine diphosphorylase